jgi:adenylate kinase family enzyme
MVFGHPSGGKSSFAYGIHQALGLPLHHIDKYFL